MPSMQQFESTLVHDHTGISHRSTRILFGGMLAGATLYLYGLNALHESNSARLLKNPYRIANQKADQRRKLVIGCSQQQLGSPVLAWRDPEPLLNSG
jgi:hypothetical protein